MTKKVESLYKCFQDHFKIGAAINEKTMDSSKDLILQHFNSLTAENEMKFVSLHPAEDDYHFETADRMVQFAQENNKRIRGHTLVWHNQTSNWVFQHQNGDPVDRETLLERMKNHIETVVRRYRGKIDAWDVVNEVISDDPHTFLRPSKWLDIIGETFVEKAFQYAHEADPDALLIYNDYNESNPIKRDKIYQLVKGLKEREVPIDGVGLQAHWNIKDPSLDNIRQAIEKYASLGLELQVTEMDVSMFSYDDRRTDLTAPTKEMEYLQAERYEKFFNVFKEYKEHIGSITFWGVADSYTWLNDFPVKGRKNWPLLFDEQHQPKQAYWKIIK